VAADFGSAQLGRRAMIPGMARSVFRTPAPDALRPATLLTTIGAGSLIVLGIALVSQHAFGIEPCPWCVIQRIGVILIALIALLGAGLARGASRVVPAVAALLVASLAVGGIVSAWHQHTVAAKQLSCAFTWADRTLMSLQLDAIWPSVFKVGATCADAANALLLGLPYEVWSGVWFAIVALAAVAVILRAGRHSRR
jgi:protein dithiol:quinone oxidoreductase